MTKKPIRPKMTDQDRETLARLVATYGGDAIEKEARRISAKPELGRRPDATFNPNSVWVSIEVRRWRGEKLSPASVRKISDELAVDFRTYAGPNTPSGGRLRKLYQESARNQKVNAQLAANLAQLVTEDRIRAGPRSHLHFPNLSRTNEKGELVGLIFDRSGRRGE